MGADVSIHVQVRSDGAWREAPNGLEWRDWRTYDLDGKNYHVYGMLGIGSVYSRLPFSSPLADRGWPEDARRWPDPEDHSWHSWGTIAELRALPWDHPSVGECGWPRWLHSDPVNAAVEQYGEDGVRVLFEWGN